MHYNGYENPKLAAIRLLIGFFDPLTPTYFWFPSFLSFFELVAEQ